MADNERNTDEDDRHRRTLEMVTHATFAFLACVVTVGCLFAGLFPVKDAPPEAIHLARTLLVVIVAGGGGFFAGREARKRRG